MKNYTVTKKFNSTFQEYRVSIVDENNMSVLPNLAYFMNQLKDIDFLNSRINEVKIYPKNSGFRDGTGGEEVDLLDDHIIRKHNEDPEILEFFNDNIEDPEIEIIAKQDLIDIFEQWRELLINEKKDI